MDKGEVVEYVPEARSSNEQSDIRWSAIVSRSGIFRLVCCVSGKYHEGSSTHKYGAQISAPVSSGCSLLWRDGEAKRGRRIVGPLFSPYEKHRKLGLKYLGPLLQERLRMREEYGNDWEGKDVRTSPR